MTKNNNQPSDLMKDILKFKIINRLKLVERRNSVGTRRESAAEHTWSTLLWVDFFLDKVTQPMNKLRVYELLMYHDLAELETGDTPLDPSNLYVNITSNKEHDQRDRETRAAKRLMNNLPKLLSDRYGALFIEWDAQKTIEARFVKAIDTFDSTVQEIDYKADWKDWSAEFLIKKKLKYLEKFPAIKEAFLELVEYFKKEGYFNQ